MTTLYNVYAEAECKNLLMIAPLETIRQIFRLHKSAAERIPQETASGCPCLLHFNGKPTAVATPNGYIAVLASRIGG